ncbi:MAG: hypothetical protein J6A81_00635 [Peptococcaceae bacterium]|nr:hypothetical protein [Peptococcaceae bacterium]
MKQQIKNVFSKRKYHKVIAGVLVGALLFFGIAPAQAGEQISKEEVVYANLQSDGSVDAIYVVNSFVLNEAGQIVDYGDYTALRNMTSMEELQFENQRVTVDAKEGRLYYEGILNDDTLPWEFSITYWLDGKNITAEELAGQDGHLQIDIQIEQNKNCNPVFFENYTLQVTLQLDTAICRNIQAKDATIASVGRNKQITYTLLPGQDSFLSISADVTDFTMEQISLNGITLSMAVELNENQYGELTGNLKKISDAAVQFDDGTLELFHGMETLYDNATILTDYLYDLKDGATLAADGGKQLEDGIDELKSGVNALQNGTHDAVDGAGQLKTGAIELEEGAEALEDGAGELLYGMEQLHGGIAEINTELRKLDAEIEKMEAELDKLLENFELTEEEKERIEWITQEVTSVMVDYGWLEKPEDLIAQLQENIKNLKELRNNIAALYDAMLALEYGSANLLAGMEELYEGTAELKKGTILLSDGIAELHDGLVILNDGTAELVKGVTKLQDGSITLSDGLIELKNGSVELCEGAIALEDGILVLEDGLITLQGGTMEFRNETADLDRKLLDELREGVDALFGNGDKVVSFVSEKNTNVQAVQFVIRTPAIELSEETIVEENTINKLTFWQKLLRLFGINVT